MRGTTPPAYRGRVRLLDIPALRCDHVFGLLRRLRGAVQEHRRRPHRGTAVRSSQYGGGDSLPARLDLHLRHGKPCGRRAQSEVDPTLPPGNRSPRRRVHHTRDPRVRKLDQPRCRPQPQRLPLLLLHPGRVPRRARDGRTSVARHHDGAVLCEGVPPGHPPSIPVLQSLLARPRYHLGGNFQPGVPGRNPAPGAITMSGEHDFDAGSNVGEDRLPGAEHAAGERTLGQEVRGYALGLALAVGLTAASFWVRGTDLVYGPGLALALLVLAVAQMGIHLIFFLHIPTAPDNENNILALAFGVLIVCLIVFGSLWVMEHLIHNMVPMQELMQMQR